MDFNERFSIVITVHDRLTTLNFCFWSLHRNSHFKDHEIVLVADRIDDPAPQPYRLLDPSITTIRELLEKGEWFKKLNISMYEKEFPNGIRDVYKAWSFGLEKARNEWICTMVDDDYYFCPEWDINIIKHLRERDPLKHVYVSVYCTFQDPKEPETDKRKGVRTIPLTRGANVRESQLIEGWRQLKTDAIYIERCGERNQLFWIPMVINRGLLRKLNPPAFTTEPPYPAAHDLNFDDRLRDQVDALKVGCLDSFVYHLTSKRGAGQLALGE